MLAGECQAASCDGNFLGDKLDVCGPGEGNTCSPLTCELHSAACAKKEGNKCWGTVTCNGEGVHQWDCEHNPMREQQHSGAVWEAQGKM